jgi:hypothetical protein
MDERTWTDRPLAEGASLDLCTTRVTREEVAFVSLVSGDLDAALSALCPAAPMLGLGEGTQAGDYAIRIARDHAALVTRAAPDLRPGWHDAGFALSRADDRFACLALRGAGAREVLARGLASPLPHASPSAALRFAGRTALLTGAEDGLRLWVERGDLTFVTSFLRAMA